MTEQVVFNMFRHQSVTEQVENHMFRHRQDHFQKYDYALGFLFALSTLLAPLHVGSQPGLVSLTGARLESFARLAG